MTNKNCKLHPYNNEPYPCKDCREVMRIKNNILGKNWFLSETAPLNEPVLVLYSDSNPPSYDIAVLFHDDEQHKWMNCMAGWLGGKTCVLDYIDEIETPTHWADLLPA